ncbi:unnamed protein product, partial [Owenia fusiformis]
AHARAMEEKVEGKSKVQTLMPDNSSQTDLKSAIDRQVVNAVEADERSIEALLDPVHVAPLHTVLTDASQYAYCGLCAITLLHLSTLEHEKKFAQKLMEEFLAHMKQPKQVHSSIVAILNGQGCDNADAFIEVLKDDVAMKSNKYIISNDLIAFALKDGAYDARTRMFIRHVAFRLGLDWDKIEEFEETVVEKLKEVEHKQTEEELKEKKSKETKKKVKRAVLIGLATVGGGTLIGLTGGLAAPLVAAGAGVIIGGAGAAALGSTVGVAIIGSLFGVAGAGLAGSKMKKRVGAVEEFEFEALSEGSQLHVTVAISGFLTATHKDFKYPWRTLDNSKEQYFLKWETKYLLELGNAMDYLVNIAMTMAAQEALKYTILSGLLAALAWPATLISAANLIDNPWGVCAKRSDEAGQQLAEVLLSRQQGKRPVTLVGFSLGARVIFKCLTEMSKRKNCEGIIEDVVMLGTPVSADPKQWQCFSKVVAGRIINGYCRSDWLLKFIYRTSSVQLNIAGLQPIKWRDRRMCNMDLTDVVEGHMDYSNKIDEILKVVGIKTKEVDEDPIDEVEEAEEIEEGGDVAKEITAEQESKKIHTSSSLQEVIKASRNQKSLAVVLPETLKQSKSEGDIEIPVNETESIKLNESSHSKHTNENKTITVQESSASLDLKASNTSDASIVPKDSQVSGISVCVSESEGLNQTLAQSKDPPNNSDPPISGEMQGSKNETNYVPSIN